MRITYKQSIFGYFFVIFALFTTAIIITEQDGEKKYRKKALETGLDSYATVIHSFLEQNHLEKNNTKELQRLADILPDSIRLTLINNDGTVFFDKDVSNFHSLENHLDRPEIQKSRFYSSGTNIRTSASTHDKYLYYAKHYPSYYIRIALPYNTETKRMLSADNMFIYISLILFAIVLLLLNSVANRFSKSISQLKRFTTDVKADKSLPQNITFPHDILGEIGQELVDIFEQKEQSKQTAEAEREKLIQHFQYSEEGLGIFSSDFKKIYVNTHFIQYLNFIISKPTFNVEALFEESDFDPINKFLMNKGASENYFSFQISKYGKIFLIQSVIFEDQSFELTIKDITKIEKNRLLKQEMTNNIAHELRTPITSIRGYLETLHERTLSKEKQDQFINNAYKQSLRLSILIDDISLISKMEEASSKFVKEKINLLQIINNVRIDLSDKLTTNNVKLILSVDENLTINGNYSLIYSIFRNLMDNSIAYAGNNIEIHIDCYMQDETYIYLSYYDTGVGIPEQYLNRIFERFYRVNEGRTRDTGGSGLGLSIVKNAILLHKGEIQAKNRSEGGLEFLFTLQK